MSYWTDSEDILYLITQRGRKCKNFVANIVSKIQEFSQTKQWGHVMSECNAADLGTRSLIEPGTDEMEKWYKGLDFLLLSKNEWPQWKRRERKITTEIQVETKKSAMFLIRHVNVTLNKPFYRNCF